MQAWGVHHGHAGSGSKGYCLAAGQKVYPAVLQNVLFSPGMAQKGQCVGWPRRRQNASGRVVTCPEGWMALKRKPRNRALFALRCIGLICKIEAGLGRV